MLTYKKHTWNKLYICKFTRGFSRGLNRGGEQVKAAFISYPDGVLGMVVEGFRLAAIYFRERIPLNNLK
jgi:hypothetical protein